MKKIILASKSLRRSEILASCGIAHKVIPSNAPEKDADSYNYKSVVEENSLIKAMTVSAEYPGDIVLGADTLVKCDDKIIGKPKNETEALGNLKMFSGKRIEVASGMAIVKKEDNISVSSCVISYINVPVLLPEEINGIFPYLKPYDKAGGFSIEGAGSFVFDDVEGSYFNILGLSLKDLKSLFLKAGINILEYVK